MGGLYLYLRRQSARALEYTERADSHEGAGQSADQADARAGAVSHAEEREGKWRSGPCCVSFSCLLSGLPTDSVTGMLTTNSADLDDSTRRALSETTPNFLFLSRAGDLQAAIRLLPWPLPQRKTISLALMRASYVTGLVTCAVKARIFLILL